MKIELANHSLKLPTQSRHQSFTISVTLKILVFRRANSENGFPMNAFFKSLLKGLGVFDIGKL